MAAISGNSAQSAIAIGAGVLRFTLRFFMISFFLVAMINMLIGDWFERMSMKI